METEMQLVLVDLIQATILWVLGFGALYCFKLAYYFYITPEWKSQCQRGNYFMGCVRTKKRCI
ncbi:MAG: hypothetical protein WEB94_01875 [Candidatus Paceibacterota bacterium]